MSVPEAAMHEDYFSAAWKYYVGLPRQQFIVKYISITRAVKHPPNLKLSLGISGTNSLHNFGADVWWYVVNHSRFL